MNLRALFVLLSLCIAWPALAGQREDANDAYATGNYSRAIQLWRLMAEQGDIEAQHNLGVTYAKGQGVIQDYKEAVKWYRLAAEQGHADAQTNLGVMYATGQGVIQDNIYAHMWLNIAASTGNANAVKNRDIIASRMTPADISKAQELARECVRKNHKGC